MCSSFLLCVFFVSLLLPRLCHLAKQPIYEEGPRWHLKKSGTPTMGGLSFLFTALLCFPVLLLLYKGVLQKTDSTLLIINFVFVMLNGAIGVYDDYKKIKEKRNEGLTPFEKLIYQTLLCALYLFARVRLTTLSTVVVLLGREIPLGLFYYPLALFVMVGIINCANLTDGIDGLASSVGLCIGVVFFLFVKEKAIVPSLFSLFMAGVALAFLLFNRHPAKIFMGDSGSLFLGACAVSIAFCLENPFFILLIGGVYVIEGFSVVLQVLYYKKTKKRLFRMAPIHHHLEMCGIKENGICLLGIAVTILLSIVAYICR